MAYLVKFLISSAFWKSCSLFAIRRAPKELIARGELLMIRARAREIMKGRILETGDHKLPLDCTAGTDGLNFTHVLLSDALSLSFAEALPVGLLRRFLAAFAAATWSR